MLYINNKHTRGESLKHSFIGIIFMLLIKLISLVSFVVWIICIVKAFRREKFKIPFAGDTAEKI